MLHPVLSDRLPKGMDTDVVGERKPRGKKTLAKMSSLGLGLVQGTALTLGCPRMEASGTESMARIPPYAVCCLERRAVV